MFTQFKYMYKKVLKKNAKYNFFNDMYTVQYIVYLHIGTVI